MVRKRIIKVFTGITIVIVYRGILYHPVWINKQSLMKKNSSLDRIGWVSMAFLIPLLPSAFSLLVGFQPSCNFLFLIVVFCFSLKYDPLAHLVRLVRCWWTPLVLLLVFIIYLTVLGLSCGTPDLCCVAWDLLLWSTDCLSVAPGLSCPVACGNLVPQPVIELIFPALQGRF